MQRKNRSSIDALLVAPTVADRKIRAAILEWVRGAVGQLGGWRCLSPFQRSQLVACKISLSILMVEEKVLTEVGSLEDARAVLAGRNIETHSNLLRKHVKDLGLLAKPRLRAERGTIALADIVKEYSKRERRG
jgi:hypothetical protein